MSLPLPTHIPVGNQRDLEPIDYALRSRAQQDCVIAIMNREDFDFALTNPFSSAQVTPTYRGPFWFMWYDENHDLHSDRIATDGTIATRIKV
jgi:hypothetical protein